MVTANDVYVSDGVVRPNVGTYCTTEEGKTRQSEADQADINKILKRLDLRELTSSQREGIYADVSGITNFRDAMEKVERGKEAFMSLKANVRSAFDNDVALFLDAFQSVEGIAKLRELGVVPEAEEVVLNRAEAAVENRAAVRSAARARAARVAAAEQDPPVSK